MFDACIEWLLTDFGLVMLGLALVLIVVHLMLRIKGVSYYEILYRWMALLPLGVTCIYAAICHAVFPETSAAMIGWEPSPFQFEVAMNDFGLGVLAILSFNARYSFRLATVIMAAIQLWGDALNHLYQMLALENFNPGNAGSWFWMDILIPAVLILALCKLKSKSLA